MHYRKRYYDQYITVHVQPHADAFTEQVYERWANAAQDHLKGWLSESRSDPVLDIGCGSGKLLYLLRRLGYSNLTGIDLSPEQIRIASQWLRDAVIIEGDAREFLTGSVDRYGLICAFDVIEHFRKEEVLPFLELVYQALKPGGRFILQTPNAESPNVGSVAYADFSHEWFFTPEGLEHVLRLAGFSGFQARESGPHIHGVKSLVRFGLWRLIRLFLALWNLAEMGSAGSGVYSRVFVATAVKEAVPASDGGQLSS